MGVDCPEIRAMVLAHEREHILGRDPLLVLASLLLVAVALVAKDFLALGAGRTSYWSNVRNMLARERNRTTDTRIFSPYF
jgi:Zn-dependent protease with chaperone function